MIPTGKARLAGVMGWPVEHSLSPCLHGYWLDAYEIDGAYVPLAVAPEDFADALRMLARLGFQGANVTVPHKEAAFQVVDETDDQARHLGAVNTVIVQEDGTLLGRNTDGFGFLENLKAAEPAWTAATGPAVIIGAGGAARAVVAALLGAGVPEVKLVNRTRQRADKLASDLGGAITAVPWKDRASVLSGAALLVNTTTLGMTGYGALELDLDDLPSEALVNDIVYTPLETPLLAEARKRGNRAVDGLGMLLHQARPGFAAWFGREPEVTPDLRTAVLETRGQ